MKYETIYNYPNKPWRLIECITEDKLVNRFELVIGLHANTEVIWAGNKCLTFRECDIEYRKYIRIQNEMGVPKHVVIGEFLYKSYEKLTKGLI